MPLATPSPLVGEGRGGGSCRGALICRIARPPPPTPPHKGEGRSSRHRCALTWPFHKSRSKLRLSIPFRRRNRSVTFQRARFRLGQWPIAAPLPCKLLRERVLAATSAAACEHCSRFLRSVRQFRRPFSNPRCATVNRILN